MEFRAAAHRFSSSGANHAASLVLPPLQAGLLGEANALPLTVE